MVYGLCCAGGATTCMPCLHVMPYSYSYNCGSCAQNPCGKIATAFKPYPAAAAEAAAEGAEEFPVCRHGGWQECGMQSEALCVANMTGDPLAMAALVDCHFRLGTSG